MGMRFIQFIAAQHKTSPENEAAQSLSLTQQAVDDAKASVCHRAVPTALDHFSQLHYLEVHVNWEIFAN